MVRQIRIRYLRASPGVASQTGNLDLPLFTEFWRVASVRGLESLLPRFNQEVTGADDLGAYVFPKNASKNQRIRLPAREISIRDPSK